MHLTEIDNITFEGIDFETDPPSSNSAYIVSADYFGIEMTKEQLKEINRNRQFVKSEVAKRLN